MNAQSTKLLALAGAMVPCALGERAEERRPYAPMRDAPDRSIRAAHEGWSDDPWMPTAAHPPEGAIAHCGPWTRGVFQSVQVNVDALGRNILGDAANEPSIAVDPTDPRRIVIGWRQFDSVESAFRQAGWAYSHDGGRTWTFPGVLEPGVFRSDPVLDADSHGNFYYYSIRCGGSCGDLFKSMDGGVSWWNPVPAYGDDKPWMTIDRTGGIGDGNIYCTWGVMTRSTDGGKTFSFPVHSGGTWGTVAVGPDGAVYTATPPGAGSWVEKSTNAQDPNETPVFEVLNRRVNLGGGAGLGIGPNPDGLGGQAWIAPDYSGGARANNVYLLASVEPRYPADDPYEVMFARSTDGGWNWSDPVRVNDDPQGNGAWQWFGTMSVAPNGRIDAIWNDTRNSGEMNLCEVYYAYSTDTGVTWSENVPLSPMFDSWVGWPVQRKLGDYYHMVSDDLGANLAYAATFNGEQDIYFLRIGAFDCNTNGVADGDDIANGTNADCDANGVPDECDPDCNNNDTPDPCEAIAAGDFDADGDVGVNDHAALAGCMTSPDEIPSASSPPCAHTCLDAFDFDSDSDVDLFDFAAFQSILSADNP